VSESKVLVIVGAGISAVTRFLSPSNHAKAVYKEIQQHSLLEKYITAVL